MARHTTEFAIRAITNALRKNIPLHAVKSALLADGFPARKAAIIILWAQKNIAETAKSLVQNIINSNKDVT
jgi:hypothetical protein